MIKRIVAFSMFALLIVALVLYFAGVRAETLDSLYVNDFLKNVANRYNAWKFQIPSIPKVPNITRPSGKVFEIITALIWVVNLLIAIVNFIITLVNFLVMFFNTIISILQFILTMVYSIKDWINLFTVSLT